MVEKAFKLLSLAQLFEAPDQFVGHFGWMCGYSADAGFLGNAAERFTRQTEKQRAHAGKTALVLMLDPGNPQISCVDAPGILHLGAKTRQNPFSLLHAKVALIGFCHESDQTQWRLRLIISTGNWTRETLEESLDLAWSIEISSHELAQRLDDDAKQRCADFKAAWSLIDWLRDYFDLRALSAGYEHHHAIAKEFEDWIGAVSRKVGLPRARIFDSRRESLLAQLPEMIKATGIEVVRNYLSMGSGFYESSEVGGAVPSVVAEIIGRLQHAKLLTRAPEVDIFVNPNACQAVADSVSSIRERGWHVRKAGKPEKYFGKAERALHAKFLFSANWRENSELCNSAWVYFGSGNLTRPGFSQKMSKRGGNLEAGVVFAPQQLIWSSKNDAEQYKVVANVLPLQWDEEYDGSPGHLRAGGDMPDREEIFIAAPVAYLTWNAMEGADRGGWLSTPDREVNVFEAVDAAGTVCRHDEQQRIWWPDEQPRQVELRWQADEQQHSALVPVLDEFGRLAGTRLAPLGIDEAWLQLASFPMPPDEDDLPDGDGREYTNISGGPPQSIGTGTGDYPIRQMMQLIENIAVKQTTMPTADWASWCVRLEQSLAQASGSDVLRQFQSFAVNPLSPLWQPPFRPVFAEGSKNAEGKRYEEVLRRVEKAWKVDNLERLGKGSSEAAV